MDITSIKTAMALSALGYCMLDKDPTLYRPFSDRETLSAEDKKRKLYNQFCIDFHRAKRLSEESLSDNE